MRSSRNGEQIRGLPRRRVEKEKGECDSKRVTPGSCGDGSVLYLDCINVKILGVIFVL